MRPYDFCGRENHESAEKLSQGLTGKIVGRGQSMTPIRKDKQAVICEPEKSNLWQGCRETLISKVTKGKLGFDSLVTDNMFMGL